MQALSLATKTFPLLRQLSAALAGEAVFPIATWNICLVRWSTCKSSVWFCSRNNRTPANCRDTAAPSTCYVIKTLNAGIQGLPTNGFDLTISIMELFYLIISCVHACPTLQANHARLPSWAVWSRGQCAWARAITALYEVSIARKSKPP